MDETGQLESPCQCMSGTWSQIPLEPQFVLLSYVEQFLSKFSSGNQGHVFLKDLNSQRRGPAGREPRILDPTGPEEGE